LETGDAIETENGSYVTINDSRATITESGSTKDKYNCEIFVYPNSEVKLDLIKKESHPEPAFMVPSQVPNAIKRNSSNTVIDYNFAAVSLVRGIFHVGILDENKEVNHFLKMPSGYPEIEFLHSSRMVENIQDKIMAKMPANVLAMYKNRLPPKSKKVCDEISAFIELCQNNSIVIFGTANSVRNRGSGKVASPNVPKAVPGDYIITGKITVVNDRIYSDASGSIDPRARAIMKNKLAIGRYSALLAQKKEYEQKLKEIKEKKSKPAAPESPASKKEKEERKAELLKQHEYYKQVEDKDMAAAVQMQLDEIEPPKETEAARREKEKMKIELLKNQQQAKQAGNTVMIDTIQMQLDTLDQKEGATEEYMEKMLAWCDKEIAKLKPDLNSNFPGYSSVSAENLI
jgi:hypothetical protein